MKSLWDTPRTKERLKLLKRWQVSVLKRRIRTEMSSLTMKGQKNRPLISMASHRLLLKIIQLYLRTESIMEEVLVQRKQVLQNLRTKILILLARRHSLKSLKVWIDRLVNLRVWTYLVQGSTNLQSRSPMTSLVKLVKIVEGWGMFCQTLSRWPSKLIHKAKQETSVQGKHLIITTHSVSTLV